MKTVWLIGAGEMAVEYSKVLEALKTNYVVIGRGEKSAKSFERKTGRKVIKGGVEDYIKRNKAKLPDAVIVAVYPLSLKDVTIKLIQAGIKRILVEKPAGIDRKEVVEICKIAAEQKSEVYVAYNRRFYASVQKARQIIAADGGATSYNFEFTEWSHVIDAIEKPKAELNHWFMANSTHVVDLAFFLGGCPEKISTYVNGELGWYTKAEVFSGAGKTYNGTPFSYKANWGSAGRWAVEILTRKRKLILSPLEKLQEQLRGTIIVQNVEIDDAIDKEYKPGLYCQTECFLNDRIEDMIDIEEHARMTTIYECMEQEGIAISSDKWKSYEELL